MFLPFFSSIGMLARSEEDTNIDAKSVLKRGFTLLLEIIQKVYYLLFVQVKVSFYSRREALI
jgi:hypothetical protein